MGKTVKEAAFQPYQAEMKVRPLTDLAQIEKIYSARLQGDFPENGAKPFLAIDQALSDGTYECYGFFMGRNLLGYAFFVKSGTDYLLDYFAIAEAHRNKGYGSVFMNRLFACLPKDACILCEAGDPDSEEDEDTRERSEKRTQFYLRNGFRETGVTARVFETDYRILIRSGKNRCPDSVIAEKYAHLYRCVLPDFFFETCFSVTA